jgi:hypothetical protein
MIFFDCVERWSEIEPHLGDAEFNRILNHDFNRMTWGRWRKPFPSKERPYPASWEGYNGHVGRYLGPEGEYRKFVLDLCCHWLVNANLRLAQLILPTREWRIIYSRQNHCVYDGHDTLFDLEGLALYGDAWLAYEFAVGLSGRQLAPGQYLPVKWAEHFQIDEERKRRGTPAWLCPFCEGLPPCCSEYAAFIPQYRRYR